MPVTRERISEDYRRSFCRNQKMTGSAFLTEAQDREEAVRLASLHPTVQVSAGEKFGQG
jgi:hypothetical protein